MNKEGLREALRKHIDEVFKEFMDDNDIKTGDISPFQALDLDNRIDGLTELIFVVCEQNRGRLCTKEEVIQYVKDKTPQFTIDVGAPRDFLYNEGLLEDGERYLIDGNTIKLYLE